jgi:hypothetical protein
MGFPVLSQTPAHRGQPEVQAPLDPEAVFLANPTRILALGLAVALLFLRVSMLHQTLAYVTRINFRILYIIGVPAFLATFFVGGIRRTFARRPAYYWMGFVICLILAVPFSSWRSASLALVISYLRADFLMLFVVGGLVITWRECKLMMYAVFWGCVADLVTARYFVSESYTDRFELQFGTVKNANDFAAHLLLVVPFLLWPVFASRNVLFRVTAFAGFAYGSYLILASGSRGALVALFADGLFFLWRGTARQKVALLLGAPILFVGLITILPQSAWLHIKSFSADSSDADGAAIASSEARRYLFWKSVTYSFQHPLFGVGPGQFAEYEGMNNQVGGTEHGSWHDTHNSFTKVSSECGIPALLFFTAGIFSTFLLLGSAFRQARARQDCQDIRIAAFCVMLGMVGHCAAIAFLNFSYFFYLPAMAGLAIAFSGAAQREFRARGVAI